jgi:TRAP-type C4-dicarboxylate transport system substrate-binding protein
MVNAIARYVVLAFALLPFAAVAEPITLKLAYFSSDQTRVYNVVVKPFVAAVNENARGGTTIVTFPGGSLGKDQAQQPQLVRSGVADIAFVALGVTGNQFPDHAVMELPGLFNDLREATLVHSRIMASGIMEGYDDFFVIAAFATEPESIHARPPIATLDDLRGKRIRANNSLEAAALAKLGMSPVLLPIGKTPEAISGGTIDGAATAIVPLVDFGLGRVVTYHYFLRLGSSVMTILMNRKKFGSLPKSDQDVIRKYSGEWPAARFIEGSEPYNEEFLEKLKSDPSRKVIFPSQSEIDVADEAFRAVSAAWAEASPHNRKLLSAVEAELRQLRSVR